MYNYIEKNYKELHPDFKFDKWMLIFYVILALFFSILSLILNNFFLGLFIACVAIIIFIAFFWIAYLKYNESVFLNLEEKELSNKEKRSLVQLKSELKRLDILTDLLAEEGVNNEGKVKILMEHYKSLLEVDKKIDFIPIILSLFATFMSLISFFITLPENINYNMIINLISIFLLFLLFYSAPKIIKNISFSNKQEIYLSLFTKLSYVYFNFSEFDCKLNPKKYEKKSKKREQK